MSQTPIYLSDSSLSVFNETDRALFVGICILKDDFVKNIFGHERIETRMRCSFRVSANCTNFLCISFSEQSFSVKNQKPKNLALSYKISKRETQLHIYTDQAQISVVKESKWRKMLNLQAYLAHTPNMGGTKVQNSQVLCEPERNSLKAREQNMHEKFFRYIGSSKLSQMKDLKLPRISLCLSGGGYRAMVASIGALTAFEKEGLLDCISYISSLSGR